MDVVMPSNFINPHPFKVSVLAYGCASAVSVLQRPKMHFRIPQRIVEYSRSKVHLGCGFYHVLFFSVLHHLIYSIPHGVGHLPSYPKTFSINFSPTHSTWNSLRGSQPSQSVSVARRHTCVRLNLSTSKIAPCSTMRFLVRLLANFVGLIIIVSISIIYHKNVTLSRGYLKKLFTVS